MTTPLVVAVMLAIGQEWKTSVQKRQIGNIKAREDSDQNKEDSGQKEEQKATSRIGKHNEKKHPPPPSPSPLAPDTTQRIITAGEKEKIRCKSLSNSDKGVNITEKERERDLHKRLEELERELVAIRQQLMTSNREEADSEISVNTNTSANTDCKNKNDDGKECSAVNSKNIAKNGLSEGVQSIDEDYVPTNEENKKIEEKEEKEEIEKVDLPVYTNAQMMYIYYLRLNSLRLEDVSIRCKEKLLSVSKLQLSDLTQLFDDFQKMVMNFSDATDKIFDDTLQYIYDDLNKSYQSFISFENSVEFLVISEINELHFFLLNSMGYKNIQNLISVELELQDSRLLNEKNVLLDVPSDSSSIAKNVLSVSPSPHQHIVHENNSEIKITNNEIQNDEKKIGEKKKKNFFWWIK